MVVQIFVDGACEPVNPGGIATYGFVIHRQNKKLNEGAGVVGHRNTSNNVAEYFAAIEAFRWLIANRLLDERVVVQSDSELMTNQLKGLYAVRAPRIRPLHEELRRLTVELKRIASEQRKLLKIKFEWIPREKNEEADALSRRAYENFCAENPSVLQRYTGHLATSRQRELMQRLKIPIPAGLSKRAASRLIDDRLNELKSKQVSATM